MTEVLIGLHSGRKGGSNLKTLMHSEENKFSICEVKHFSSLCSLKDTVVTTFTLMLLFQRYMCKQKCCPVCYTMMMTLAGDLNS